VSTFDGFTVDHDAWAELGYRWSWAGTTSLVGGARVLGVEAFDDAVVLHDSLAGLTVLSASTGSVVWAAQVDRPETKILGVTRDGSALLVSTPGTAYELELKTGNIVGRQAISPFTVTPPTVLPGGHFVVADREGVLEAHSRKFRLGLWRYGLRAAAATPSVLVNDTTLAAVSDEGQIFLLDPRTARSKVRVEMSGGLAAPVATDGVRVFAASLDQSAYCFAADDGSRIWRYRTEYPLTISPVVDAGLTYISTREKGLVALDTDSGEEVWHNAGLAGARVIARNRGINAAEVLVWTEGGQMAAVDRATGEVIASLNAGGVRGVRADAFEGGSVYVLTGLGTVLKFSPR
jgi:outer membrane protein assembly factor BamB